MRRRPRSKSPFKRSQGQVNSFGPWHQLNGDLPVDRLLSAAASVCLSSLIVAGGAGRHPLDNFWRRKPTSTNYISLERKFIGESDSFSVMTKCFGFAILWVIFAELPKFLGVRKNNKRMEHKHVIYHFTARHLEIMNICFANIQIWRIWKAFMNFVKFVIAHIFAVSKYFAEQIIYFDSPDHTLQNDIQHAQIWQFLEDRL